MCSPPGGPSPRRMMDEERRLCYVGITRAKAASLSHKLQPAATCIPAPTRIHPSRFLDDIPEGMLDILAAPMRTVDVWAKEAQAGRGFQAADRIQAPGQGGFGRPLPWAWRWSTPSLAGGRFFRSAGEGTQKVALHQVPGWGTQDVPIALLR